MPDLIESPYQGFGPLEHVTLPAEILRQHGALRTSADTPCLIDAQNDLEAIQIWLNLRAYSPHTKKAYQREAERLLLWSAFARKKPLSGLTAEDYSDYVTFLGNPQPKEAWCSTKTIPRGEPGWRPFRGPLSPASQTQAVRAINALLNFLVQANYLHGNPLGLNGTLKISRPSKQDSSSSTTDRYLPARLFPLVAEAIDAQPYNTWLRQYRYHTDRWMISLLYGLGLRSAEAIALTMNSFISVERPEGPQWWCQLIGKGEKPRRIPVPAEVLQEMKYYREWWGLPPLPDKHDERPVFLRSKPANGSLGLSYAELYRRITTVMSSAAARARDEHDAGILQRVSPHWLRHTNATIRVDSGDHLLHVSRSLGHSSVEITDRIYVKAEEDSWYKGSQHAAMFWPGTDR